MLTHSFFLHSAAWAMAGAARSLDEALKLQQRIIDAAAEEKGEAGEATDTDGVGFTEILEDQVTEQSVPKKPTSRRPASRLIASARKSIRARHQAEDTA